MRVESKNFTTTVKLAKSTVTAWRSCALLACLVVIVPPSLSRNALADSTLRPQGVSQHIEKSIHKGLEFLKKHQKRNGSFAMGTDHTRQGSSYRIAMTAFAGLAFLASGSTPSRGPYADQIREIRDYLLAKATKRHDGLLTNGMEQRPMYSHAFGMTFFAHIYGQETDPTKRNHIRTVLHKAVQLCRNSQTNAGGWGYMPNFHSDEGTLTVTQLQGLRACQDVGIYVDKSMIDRAVHYIEISTNPNGSVRYHPGASPANTRHGVTCASIVALWQAGRYNDPLFKRIGNYMERHIISDWGRRRFHRNWNHHHHGEFIVYYMAQAKYFMRGENWQSFYEMVAAELLRTQDVNGSWEGKDAGQIYGTCVALLALQLPYNRLTTFRR